MIVALTNWRAFWLHSSPPTNGVKRSEDCA